jgi:hypothetical protein
LGSLQPDTRETQKAEWRELGTTPLYRVTGS